MIAILMAMLHTIKQLLLSLCNLLRVLTDLTLLGYFCIKIMSFSDR